MGPAPQPMEHVMMVNGRNCRFKPIPKKRGFVELFVDDEFEGVFSSKAAAIEYLTGLDEPLKAA